MRFIHAVLAGSLVASTALGGPINPREVPAKSRAIVHVDIEALLESEIGEFILDHADGLDELQEVKQELGIDPLKDISDITVCLLGNDEEDVVILATVSDAIEAVLEKLDDFGDEIDHDVRQRYGGDLHTFRIDGKRVGALVREARGGYRIAVSPNADLLEIVGETIDGDRESIRGRDHALGRIRARDGAFIQLMVFDLSDLPMNRELPGQIADKVTGVFAQIGEADGKVFFNARIGLDDEDDAKDLVKVGQGFLALLTFAQMLDDEHDEELAMVIELAKSLWIDRDGSVVEVSLELDAEQVMELIEQAD